MTNVKINLKNPSPCPTQPQITFTQLLNDNNGHYNHHQLKNNPDNGNLDLILKKAMLIEYTRLLSQLESLVGQSLCSFEQLASIKQKHQSKIDDLENQLKSALKQVPRMSMETASPLSSSKVSEMPVNHKDSRRRRTLNANNASIHLKGNFLLQCPVSKVIEEKYMLCRKRPQLEKFARYYNNAEELNQSFAFLKRESEICLLFNKIYSLYKPGASFHMLRKQQEQIEQKEEATKSQILTPSQKMKSKPAEEAYDNILFSYFSDDDDQTYHQTDHIQKETPRNQTYNGRESYFPYSMYGNSAFYDNQLNDTIDEDDVDQVLGEVHTLQKKVPKVRSVRFSHLDAPIFSRKVSIDGIDSLEENDRMSIDSLLTEEAMRNQHSTTSHPPSHRLFDRNLKTNGVSPKPQEILTKLDTSGTNHYHEGSFQNDHYHNSPSSNVISPFTPVTPITSNPRPWQAEDIRLSSLSDIRNKQYRLQKLCHSQQRLSKSQYHMSSLTQDVGIVHVMMERLSIRREGLNLNQK